MRWDETRYQWMVKKNKLIQKTWQENRNANMINAALFCNKIENGWRIVYVFAVRATHYIHFRYVCWFSDQSKTKITEAAITLLYKHVQCTLCTTNWETKFKDTGVGICEYEKWITSVQWMYVCMCVCVYTHEASGCRKHREQ